MVLFVLYDTMFGCFLLYLLLLSTAVFSLLLLLLLLQSLLRSRGALMEGRFRWNHMIAAVVLVVYVVVVIVSGISVLGHIEMAC